MNDDYQSCSKEKEREEQKEESQKNKKKKQGTTKTNQKSIPMPTSPCERDRISKKIHMCKQNVTQGEIRFFCHVPHAVWNGLFHIS